MPNPRFRRKGEDDKMFAKYRWCGNGRPAETRIERQQRQDEATNFAELPTACDWGCKRNSKGKVEKWKGYKLHLVVGDGDIPLCAFLSSASMHDSQAMIPMMQRASASFDYDRPGRRNRAWRIIEVAMRGQPPQFTG